MELPCSSVLLVVGPERGSCCRRPSLTPTMSFYFEFLAPSLAQGPSPGPQFSLPVTWLMVGSNWGWTVCDGGQVGSTCRWEANLEGVKDRVCLLGSIFLHPWFDVTWLVSDTSKSC